MVSLVRPVLLSLAALHLAGCATTVHADCVALTASATQWNAVTWCADWYAAFTNTGTRVAEGTESVKVVATAASVSSFEECALNCYNKSKCQWFKVTSNTDGSSKKCTYYQHLALSEASSSGSSSTVSQFGFVLAADATFLHQNIANSSSVFQHGGNYSFYKSTYDSDASAISMFIGSQDPSKAVCVSTGAPLTLHRTFSIGYQTASMLSKIASGEIINSMDALFSQAAYVTAVRDGTTVTVPTEDVTVDSTGKVVRTGSAGTTYSYSLDAFGRTQSVQGSMSYASVLRQPGQPSENAAGTSVRDQYCVSTYQSRYNTLQQLSDATTAGLAFQAGHLVGCQFSNPNGFFNFAPQSANSNTNNGCWYNAELGTSDLLKLGCSGTFHVRNTFAATPGDLTAATKLAAAATLVDASTLKTFYSNTGNDNNLLVQRPCGFFRRPVKMSLDFTVTGADANSICSVALDAIKDAGGKIFNVSSSATSVTVQRSFAHLLAAYYDDDGVFNRLRGMAAADWRADQCFAETGGLSKSVTLVNTFARVPLVVKTASSGNAKCLSMSTAGKLSAVTPCVASAQTSRWSSSSTASGSALQLVNHGGSSTAAQFAFQYLAPSVTFSGTAANISSPDDLVDGRVISSTASTCVVVDGSSAALKAFTTANASSCTTFQASYYIATVAADDDTDA